jgi:hypothetical protein
MVRMARPYQQAVGGVVASPAAAPHSPSANQSPGRKGRSPKSPSSPRRKGALSSSGESADEIQRKIEELQRQIAMMDALKQEKAEPQPSQPVPTDNDSPSEPQGTEEEEQYEEVYEEYEEEVTETEHEFDGENKPTSPPQSPKGRYGRGAAVGGAPTSPSNTNKSPSWRDRQKPSVASPLSGGSAAAAAGAAAAHHDAYRKQMDDLKQKFSFDRPGWAAPVEVVQKDAEIDSESIQNPNLKQAQMGGYQRQVKEKDIDLVRGTFVKDTPRAVEPRLAWIVVNLGKRKAGKIVMHLYGRDVHRLVDQFLDLKGHEITRDNSQTLTVVGMDPPLHVLSTRATSGLDGKAGVFGIIQEGHEIFQTVMEASDALSVKQAHIFPVVRGKKEFAKN